MNLYDDGDDFLEISKRETAKLREQALVGVSNESIEAAMNNAWEAAKSLGAKPGTRYTVVSQTAVGVNPFTGYRVVMVPTG